MRMRLLLISEAVIYIQSQANHTERANKNTACVLLYRCGYACLFTQSLSCFCAIVLNLNHCRKQGVIIFFIYSATLQCNVSGALALQKSQGMIVAHKCVYCTLLLYKSHTGKGSFGIVCVNK